MDIQILTSNIINLQITSSKSGDSHVYPVELVVVVCECVRVVQRLVEQQLALSSVVVDSLDGVAARVTPVDFASLRIGTEKIISWSFYFDFVQRFCKEQLHKYLKKRRMFTNNI